jgi:hypothetical protein
VNDTNPREASGKPVQWYLELAVPLASFGCTLAGIILWNLGIEISFQFFAAGCLISSCILAYLAWIRPRKDIVALSTPLYAFIFFVVPADYTAGVILQLLYAVSLTILLIRLKYRFGSTAPLQGNVEEYGPLKQYAETVTGLLPRVSPAISGDAGSVFIRFAQGEYDMAARLAATRSQEQPEPEDDPVGTAFAIVAEQAAHMDTGTVPSALRQFGAGQQAFLFHPEDTGLDPEQAYAAALDNALLLLYAVARINSPSDGKTRLDPFRQFAARLAAKG